MIKNYINSVFVPKDSSYIKYPKAVSRKNARNMPLPPGTKRSKRYHFATKTIKFFTNINKNFGDSSSFYMGNQLCVVVFSPSSIEELFFKHQKSFMKGRAWRQTRPFWGDGLFASEDPNHIFYKRMMQPFFHKNFIGNYIKSINNSVDENIGRISEGKIDFVDTSSYYTMESTIKSFLGSKNADVDRLVNNFDLLIRVYPKSIVLPTDKIMWGNTKIPPFLKTERYRKEIQEEITNIVNERKSATTKENDLLQFFIDEGVDEEKIIDEAKTILGAGYETSSSLISWVIARLAIRKDILKKVQEEADSMNWIKESKTPSIKEVMSAEYTIKVINETLRLSPPGWLIARTATKDINLSDGTFIPEGAELFICPYVTHRKEEFFHKSKEFNPDRWTEEFKKQLPRGAFLPFIYGSRKCLGDHFAMLSATMFVLKFAHMFDWDKAWENEGLPKFNVFVSIRPKEGVPIYIKKRQPS